MKDIFKHFEVNGKEYPLVFNINVIETMQESYGSIEEWSKMLQPEDGAEPKLKDVIFMFQECINEGIDMENEEKGENRPFLTKKQVGRVIGGLTDKASVLTSLVTESNDGGKQKNVQTEQNQAIQ